MKKIDILHMYAGTSGSAGLYIKEIYSTLSNHFVQESIVNYYYPFSDGRKVFYKYSELSSPYKFSNNYMRLLIRFCELCYALIYSLFYLLSHKVRILNYSLTSDLKVEYYFLKLIKQFTNTKIIITCHDVLPFGSNDPELLRKKIEIKRHFFLIADYLIVHNENSKIDLENFYNLSSNILEYPFPIMDLKSIYSKKELDSKINSKNFVIGMFGHFRLEKGLDTLLEAWKIFYKEQKNNVELIIAGNFPSGHYYDLKALEVEQVKIITHFINDETYCDLIRQTDLVVLPYKRGTNSGIPSSVISLNTLVLTSDIPMFSYNKLLSPPFLFKTDDPIALADKLSLIYQMTSEEHEQCLKENQTRYNDYKLKFSDKIITVYSNLLNSPMN